MKKIYIQPQIEINNIETESFLCSSGDGIEEEFLQGETIINEYQILSKDKKYDIWDMDE